MATWDPNLYLQFSEERTQPARDLVERVRHCFSAAKTPYPRTAIDVGCGPGNSTELLHKVFPQTKVLGIDNSPEMISKAHETYPDLLFMECDAREVKGFHDLIFSNACLQWVPNHDIVIPELLSHVNLGGYLAVQIPINQEEPLFMIRAEVAADPHWGFSEELARFRFDTLTPNDYERVLYGFTDKFVMWETTYYHRLPNHEAILQWMSGTNLRPYLDALSPDTQEEFRQEILGKLRGAYPLALSGEVIMRFHRFFFIAERTNVVPLIVEPSILN